LSKKKHIAVCSEIYLQAQLQITIFCKMLMTENQSQSPLSSAQLRHTPERFEDIFGLSVSDFDALLQRLSDLTNNAEQKQPESDLAEEVSITLLSIRQSTTHAVLGVCFGREESVVGDIVNRLEPLLEAAQAHQDKGSSATRAHNPQQDQPENIDKTLRLLQELQIYQVELKLRKDAWRKIPSALQRDRLIK